MGLGKTLQAIALIAHAPRPSSEEHGDRPRSPAVPRRRADQRRAPTGRPSARRFAPGLAVVADHRRRRPSAAGRPRRIAIAGADVVITSYTLFRLDFEEYNGSEWAGLLLDEAQFVKNHQSRAHQCARRLRGPVQAGDHRHAAREQPDGAVVAVLDHGARAVPEPDASSPSTTSGPIERDARRASAWRSCAAASARSCCAAPRTRSPPDLPAKQEQVLELELHPKHRKVYETHLQRERQKVLGLIDDMNANRFEIFRSLTMLRQLSLDASLVRREVLRRAVDQARRAARACSTMSSPRGTARSSSASSRSISAKAAARLDARGHRLLLPRRLDAQPREDDRRVQGRRRTRSS